MDRALIFTCEHASRAVPAAEKKFFAGAERVLQTHRGWDIGVLPVALALAKNFRAPLFEGKYTRLLVDLNRSPANPAVFSEFSRHRSPAERAQLLAKYHTPHWSRVRARIRADLKKSGCVWHFGVHSFTPVFKGYRRPTDIGLLCRLGNADELRFVEKWQRWLRRNSDFQVHRNRPYRGGNDGLITRLYDEFPRENYAGFEIEVNQRLLASRASAKKISDLLIGGLEEIL